MSDRPMHALILAGGSGTRLWPMSRRGRPKQLLPLLGETTLLESTVARIGALIPPDRVWVLTNQEYVEATRAQLPQVPPTQVVAEPEALGTAAAIGLGASLLGARDADAIMVVLPADHVIQPTAMFLDDLARAADIADEGWLVTFGIPPTEAATGYGYIELGERLASLPAGHRVARFVEKPDPGAARQLLAGGRHLWNSGMFVWRVDAIQNAYRQHLPALAAHLAQISALAERGPAALSAGLGAIWAQITDRTTIDYGIMEHSTVAACLPATFAWNDIGSWAAVADALAAAGAAGGAGNGPCLIGDAWAQDAPGVLVFGRGSRLVAAVGVSDLVIVDTPDAVLVCHRDHAQDVKRLVERLAAAGRTDVL